MLAYQLIDLGLACLILLALVALVITQRQLNQAQRRIAELERVAGILYPWD